MKCKMSEHKNFLPFLARGNFTEWNENSLAEPLWGIKWKIQTQTNLIKQNFWLWHTWNILLSKKKITHRYFEVCSVYLSCCKAMFVVFIGTMWNNVRYSLSFIIEIRNKKSWMKYIWESKYILIQKKSNAFNVWWLKALYLNFHFELCFELLL